jgi:hypothetical protein
VAQGPRDPDQPVTVSRRILVQGLKGDYGRAPHQVADRGNQISFRLKSTLGLATHKE